MRSQAAYINTYILMLKKIFFHGISVKDKKKSHAFLDHIGRVLMIYQRVFENYVGALRF